MFAVYDGIVLVLWKDRETVQEASSTTDITRHGEAPESVQVDVVLREHAHWPTWAAGQNDIQQVK